MNKVIIVILTIAISISLVAQENQTKTQEQKPVLVRSDIVEVFTILSEKINLLTERIAKFEQEKCNVSSPTVLYFTSSIQDVTVANTTTTLLSYIISNEGIYNIDYGATLQFKSSGNFHGALCLYINKEKKNWRCTYGGNSPYLELDCHYQYFLKKGDTIEIKAERIHGDVDLWVRTHALYYAPPYMRLTKIN